MAEATIKQIIEELEKRGANKPCARCGFEKFAVVSKTLISIQSDFSAFQIGGESIPAVIIACSKCGNLSTHALGALGLLEGGKK